MYHGGADYGVNEGEYKEVRTFDPYRCRNEAEHVTVLFNENMNTVNVVTRLRRKDTILRPFPNIYQNRKVGE